VREVSSCFVSEGLLVFSHDVLSILFSFFSPLFSPPPEDSTRLPAACGGSGHSRELAICRDGL
jgi:hypothetical protein